MPTHYIMNNSGSLYLMRKKCHGFSVILIDILNREMTFTGKSWF